MKFGGTSMGSPDSIRNVTSIIQKYLEKDQVIVVVSAASGITDQLIEIANTALTQENGIEEKFEAVRKRHEELISGLFNNTEKITEEINNLLDQIEEFIQGIKLIKELSPHSFDFISSYGERLSATILAHYLDEQAIKSEAVMADTFLTTDTVASNAKPDMQLTREKGQPILRKLTDQKITPVVTGFMGRSIEGKITTLGRGGSDYTSSIVGAIIEANEIQIWTDVTGIYTTDPRICPDAKPHPIVSFREASELARFGAKVLHPRTIIPARAKQIPVVIKSTFEPDHEGTTVTFDESKVPESIKGVSIKKDVKLVTICSSEMLMTHGFLAKLFTIFDRHNISVDIVATSEVTVSVSIEQTPPAGLITELEQLGEITVHDNLQILSIIGSGLKNNIKTNAEILNALAKENVDVKVIMQGSTQINFSLIIDEKDAINAAQVVHNVLFND